MAERKKGGLGVIAANTARHGPEDPLDTLFGGGASAGKQSTPPDTAAPAKAGDQAKAKLEKASFQIDRELAVKLRVYAAQKELKQYQIIDMALRKFFADQAG